MMFGGVPISVAMPPRMVAKLSGISVSPTRSTRLARGLDVHRHQQGQRGHVVHERGQNRADPTHQRDMCA